MVETDSFLFKEAPKEGFSILQGMTDESSAQFSVVLPKNASWVIEAAGQQAAPQVCTRPFSDYAVYKFTVEGLQPGQAYVLRVRDEQGRVRDERTFQALDLAPRAVKLGFASCACDHLHRDDIWQQLYTQKPDLIFFTGDNVYADRLGFLTVRTADPQQLWTRYVETRNRVAFYFQKQLTPVLAIWDDHDFGGNNQGKDYAHKEESRLVFETFFAQEARPALDRGPGIARRLTAFGADFFLLDDRTWRDGWDLPNGRMFGDEQEAWMFPRLAERPAWLISGSVYYGAYTGKDSFEGQYANDFKRWIERLRASPALCAFVSGDVHFSEVMSIEAGQLGYQTFEMVSSSIHSYTFPGHEWRWENPRRVTATSAHNFTVFEGEFRGLSITGEIASFSASAQEFRTGINVRR